jgi:hypothetical protein
VVSTRAYCSAVAAGSLPEHVDHGLNRAGPASGEARAGRVMPRSPQTTKVSSLRVILCRFASSCFVGVQQSPPSLWSPPRTAQPQGSLAHRGCLTRSECRPSATCFGSWIKTWAGAGSCDTPEGAACFRGSMTRARTCCGAARKRSVVAHAIRTKAVASTASFVPLDTDGAKVCTSATSATARSGDTSGSSGLSTGEASHRAPGARNRPMWAYIRRNRGLHLIGRQIMAWRTSPTRRCRARRGRCLPRPVLRPRSGWPLSA